MGINDAGDIVGLDEVTGCGRQMTFARVRPLYLVSRRRDVLLRDVLFNVAALAKTMGFSEFTTWVALAGAAIVAGLTAIYSSSQWVLIPAAPIGAYLGYKGEQLGRRYLQQHLERKCSQ